MALRGPCCDSDWYRRGGHWIALLAITGALLFPRPVCASPVREAAAAPIRVWMAPASLLVVEDAESGAAVRAAVEEAFGRWTEAGSGASFRFVADSAHADIQVRFIACADDGDGRPIDAITRWSRGAFGRLRYAEVQLCVTRARGEIVPVPALRALAMHEVGHLLGLEHAEAPDQIMSPVVRVRDLTDADVARVRRRAAHGLLR